MARPNKIGIDYFPFDVDFFNDEKVELVSARFGVKGEIIAIRLLCKIYRIGYYTEWNEDESTLLAKRAGDGITPSLVSDVVKELVKRGFFDETLLNRFGILTSKGVQKRYIAATGERKEVEINRDIWLIDVPKNACLSVDPPTNEVNPPNNPVNRSKSTQSKGKESKVNTNLSVSSGFCYSPLKRPEEGDCKGEVEKDWRKDYEAYLAGLRKVYLALTNDPEYIAKQGRLNPGVDVKTTLEKACVNFWATEAGWKHKKAQRTKELDWERTLTNAISQPQNKVYYERGKKFTTGSERAAERRESRAEMGKLAVAILSRSADPQDG